MRQPAEAVEGVGASATVEGGWLCVHVCNITPIMRIQTQVLSSRGAPTARAALTLTLAMQLEDIDDLPLFKREAASDVAVALGPRATDVVVTQLGGGSRVADDDGTTLVVDLDATPLGGLSPAQVWLCPFACHVRRASGAAGERVRAGYGGGGVREREG